MKSAKELADKEGNQIYWAVEHGNIPEIEMIFRRVQADTIRWAISIALEMNDGHTWPISRALEAKASELERGQL